jgi:L-threonylcarbamoyladenylate synthase
MTNDRIVSAIENVPLAAQLINAGEVVAIPTETVYGLGANALDPLAVAKLFELKSRPRFDPLIVHVAEFAAVEVLATEIPAAARQLAEQFWPGPLTLVLPKQAIVPDIVTSGLPSVAVRQPDSAVTLQLIRAAGVPIAAPSANQFGRTSPTTAAHVDEQFDARLKLILDDGPCRVGLESTVLSLIEETPVLLRPGGITVDQLVDVIGPVTVRAGSTSTPDAPGQLASHYAPRTPLVLVSPSESPIGAARIGLLCFREPDQVNRFAAVEVLSPKGDLREAAANLYAAIRRLDARQLDLIIAAPVPVIGLGVAIMDRLRRAAATFGTD